MHLLIPFAATPDPACRQALRGLPLPCLAQLLGRLQAQPIVRGTADDPELAHERALATALGLPSPAPWAALAARRLGLDPGAQAWAFVTPCHWEIGQAHVTLHDPQALGLCEDESRALLAAMQPYFSEDGLALHYERADRWLACGEPLRGLHGASVERAIGRNVAPWLPVSPLLRRLQNEMQMLLYTHPVNEARTARRQTPVNSFWLSSAGTLAMTGPSGTDPVMPLTLRDAALRNDWPAWRAAWQRFDAQECAALLHALDAGQAVQLTLCGENAAQTWTTPPTRSTLRRLLARWRRPDVVATLETLCS